MNMISTGAFLTEMDTSEKQATTAEKFAAVWEKKNAKAARAGGVSLMALSLAACGGSSSTTTTTTTPVEPTTPTTPTVVTNAPQNYTASTTADKLVGDGGNDTFTAVASTYVDADMVIDTSTTDADVVNITEGAGITPQLTNVETVNIELQNALSVALDVASVTGATALNYSRGDVTLSGGSVVTGNKAIDIDNYSAADIATVNLTGTVTTVDIDSASTDKAGGTINAETATGNVSVDGAATINANASTGTVAVDAVTNTSVSETAKATVINAAKAGTVTTHADLAGSIEINAAAATSVTVNDAQGGAKVTAATGTETTASTTITVAGIDKSGATVTVGNFPTTALKGTIDLSGTAAASDVATVYGGGKIDLDVGKTGNAVDTVSVGASEASVVYAVSSTNGAAIAYKGIKHDTYTVELDGNEAEFSGVEVTDIDVLDLSAGTAGTIDGSAWTGVGKIDLGFDNAGNAISYGAGQTYELTKDQTGLTLNMASTGSAQTVTIVAGDDNGTSTAVGTITVGAMDLNAGEDTIAGTVTIEASTANFTATSLDMGAKMNLVITGDEDVTLGQTTGGAASSIDASASTGKISLTTTTLAPTVTTGSGVDTITADGVDVHTISTGAGGDTINITNTDNGSSFDAGAGNDTINVDDVDTYSVVGGAGNDTFNTTINLKASLFGGEGTDTFVIDTAGANTMDGAFRMNSIEEFDITAANATITLDDESFASNNVMALIGDAAADVFAVVADDTSGATIDASGITIKSGSTVTIQYTGGAKADTITGGVAAETFFHSQGADSIEGGATGTDTFSIADSTFAVTGGGTATGVIINMGTTDVVGAAITAQTSKYSSAGSTVAAGTLAYAYDTNASTNAATRQTLSDIEDIIGGDGVDYIVGSDVANSITAGAGADYVDAGDGNDTIIVASAGDANSDKMHGGAGEDTLSLAGTTTVSSTDTDITGIETVLLSGTGATDVILTGQTEGFTITGNSAQNEITGGSGNDIINGGGGADIITTGSGVDTITLGSAGAIETLITTATTSANYFNVINFAVAEDLIDLNSTLLADDGTAAVANGKEGTGSADIASIATDDTVDQITVAMTNDIIDGFIAGTKTEAELEAAALAAMGDGGVTTATQTAITGLDTALADGSKVVIATIDNEDTALWYVTNTAGGTGGANVLHASEISLIGIIQGDMLTATEVATVIV